MARLFYSGWETGTNETNGGQVRSPGYTISVQNSVKRTGSYALLTGAGTTGSGNAYRVQVFSTTPSTIYLRCAVYHTSAGSGADTNTKFLSFHEGGSEHLSIAYNQADLSWKLIVLGSVQDTFYIPFSSSTWYVVEAEIVIANSGGSVTVKVNGTTALTYSGDTCATANEYISTMRIGGQTMETSTNIYFDDCAVNDTTGSYQNSWVGLGGVFYLEPTADGYQNDWTPSTGSDNYAMVDDIPPDNATTYNQAVTTGDIDSYEIDDCPAYIDTINCLQIVYRAALAESGYNETTDQLYIAGTAYDGVEHTIVPITPSFTYYLGTVHYLNPNTAAAWSTAVVNGMEAGLRITV